MNTSEVPAHFDSVDLSVLVPIKDELDSIEQLAKEAAEVLETQLNHRMGTARWELIFVDDGSTDGSWDVIERIASESSRIRGARLRRNRGKSAALAVGVALARGKIVATMDGDLQDDPNEIPAMVGMLDEPADLVAGFKADRKDPIGKRIASRIFNLLTGLMTGLHLRDHNCGLKVGRREVFDSVPLYGEMHRYLAAISHANGFRVAERAVNHRPRPFGHSKFGLERYLRGGLDLLTVVALTRYGNRPAHLLGGVGLVLGFIGVMILLYLTGIWVFTEQSIGNRPLLMLGVLMVLVAVQLASLGILAELIVRRSFADANPLDGVVEQIGFDRSL